MSHGQTPGEAVCNLAEARQMVIAHLLENNLPVPEPKIIGAHTAIQKPVEFESEDVAITPPRVISSEASELQLQIA
jgi:predicted RNase H-like HicB family nuclease